jgi:hypothetical protein
MDASSSALLRRGTETSGHYAAVIISLAPHLDDKMHGGDSARSTAHKYRYRG